MRRSDLFPDAHGDAAERVAEFWDLSYPLPVPRGWFKCLCGAAMVLKDWKFHKRRTASKNPYRCDVRMKCLNCSFVPIYGVLIDKATFERARHNGLGIGHWINWREGKAALDKAGYFD